jgi:uncharacterized membrane protein YphA (DoxX/SURF4 family)
MQAWAAALVGVVFLVAGVAKLTSRGWPSQARALGAPDWTVRVVPVLEIAVGAALVAGVPYAEVPGLLLLAAFTAFLARALGRGVAAPCACFGTLTTRPVTWWSVARNVALMALLLYSLS